MGYKLTAGESAADGIRRIAREQIDKAIGEIEDSELDVHETIHQVRKRCKKLRGLVRLVRPGMEEVYQEENAWYRDSAKALSDFRDAQALLESFDDLAGHFGGAFDTAGFKPLRDKLADRRAMLVADNPDIDQRLEDFLARMRQGRVRVDTWPLEKEGFNLLGAGLEKTYRRGRRAMKEAYRNPAAEAFHEWRKRVKYHWYHARLLQRSWQKPFARYIKELKQLSDYLGDDHDLAVLRETLAAQPDNYASPELLQAFFALAERRQTELRLRARFLGCRVYVEKPGRHGRRLRGYWDAWEQEQALRPKLDKVEDLSALPPD